MNRLIFLLFFLIPLSVASKTQSFDTSIVFDLHNRATPHNLSNDSIELLLVKSRDISATNNYHRGYIISCIRLARFYDKSGDPIKTLTTLKEAVLYCKKNKIEKYLGKIYIEKGNIYQHMGNYQQAIHSFEQARKILIINDSLDRRLGIISNNMAIIYKSQGLYHEAFKSYQAAISLAIKSHNSKLLANSNLNLGLAYLNQKKLDSALFFVTQSRFISDTTKNPLTKAIATSVIGEIYAQKGNLDSADYYYKKVENNKFIVENKYRLAGFYIKKAYLLRLKHQINKSVDLCKRALILGEETQSKEIQKTACGCLEKNYTLLNKHKEALFYYRKMANIKDSLQNKTILTTLGNVKYIIEIEKSEKKLAQSNLEKLKEKNLRLNLQSQFIKEQTTKKYIIIIALLIFVIVVYVTFLYQRIKKQKKIIQTSLLEKELLLSEIHHRVKNNLQLISSILDLQSRTVEDEHVKLIFKESQSKIAAISSIHEKLYQSEKFGSILVSNYVKELSEALILNLSSAEIDIKYMLNDTMLNLDKAIPMGLILTELITNAIKYGDKSLKITIEFKELEKFNVLTVWNNGPNFVESSNKKSFGLKMVSSLTRQLKGEFIISPKNGTLAILKIPNK